MTAPLRRQERPRVARQLGSALLVCGCGGQEAAAMDPAEIRLEICHQSDSNVWRRSHVLVKSCWTLSCYHGAVTLVCLGPALMLSGELLFSFCPLSTGHIHSINLLKAMRTCGLTQPL